MLKGNYGTLLYSAVVDSAVNKMPSAVVDLDIRAVDLEPLEVERLQRAAPEPVRLPGGVDLVATPVLPLEILHAIERGVATPFA